MLSVCLFVCLNLELLEVSKHEQYYVVKKNLGHVFSTPRIFIYSVTRFDSVKSDSNSTQIT